MLAMPDQSSLLTFLAVATTLVVVPGPNTMLILANAVGGGFRAGAATVVGLEAGTLAHGLAAGLGLWGLLAASPGAYALASWAAGGCLVWLGLRSWLRGTPVGAPARDHDAPAAVARTLPQAFLASLINPKAAAFFAVLLPPFVDPARGGILVQFVTLGAIVASIGAVVGLALAALVSRGVVGTWLWQSGVQRWQPRVTGSVLVVLGLRLLLDA